MCAVSSPRMLGLPEVDKESAKDLDMKKLWQLVEVGTPTVSGDWPRYLKGYFVKNAEYPVAGNSVLMADKVIIPKTLRAEVLIALHHSHPG